MIESKNPNRRVALITGGAKRIGRELTLTLARSGMDVALTYRESETEALDTLRTAQSYGINAMSLRMDVRDEQSVNEAVKAVHAEFGRLDLLINNAGAFDSAPLDRLSVAQWDRMFETNTRGPFLVAREALPHLKQARGRIINLGSLGGSHPWATHAHYCASKAALQMLTQTMAKAFAPEVSVNCVAPGWIHFGDDDKSSEGFAAKTPMGRNGTAEDVATTVMFFATGPHFITGQTLGVDGGLGLV